MSSDFAFSELTPVSFLRRAAAVFGDRTAIVDGDFSCTYRDFWLRARQSADLLASAGVKPGDRVAILAPNSHLLLEAHYGVPLSGGVLVALNSRLAPAELAYILEHSGARILLVDNEFADSGRSRHEHAGRSAHGHRIGGPRAGSHRPIALGGSGHRRTLVVVHQLHQRDHRATQRGDVPPPGRIPAGVGDGAARQARRRLPVSVDAADVPHERVVFSVGGHRCRWCPPLPALHRHDGDLERNRVGCHPFLRGADGAVDVGADGTREARTPSSRPRIRRRRTALACPPAPARRPRHRRRAPLRADGNLRTGRGVDPTTRVGCLVGRRARQTRCPPGRSQCGGGAGSSHRRRG